MAAEAFGVDNKGKTYHRRGAAENKSKCERSAPVFQLRQMLDNAADKDENEGLEELPATHEVTSITSDVKSSDTLFIKFIGADKLVLTGLQTVMIYDIIENKRIHNIRLTHPISSIDVWSGYLLIGSSVVHVVDTREDHWRRILVVDMDEKESLKDLSQHLAVFNSDGEFSTASMSGNKIALWPQPVKSGGMMTEKKMNYSCGPDMESISSLSVPSNCGSFLAVVGETDNNDVIINILDWNQGIVMETIKLEAGMDASVLALSPDGKYLAVKKDGKYIAEYELTYSKENSTYAERKPEVASRNPWCLKPTCTADISCMMYYHPSQTLVVGLNDGVISQSRYQWMFTEEQPSLSLFPESGTRLQSALSAFALHDNTVSAIACEDGTIWIRRNTPKPSELSSVSSELDALSVFMPGSFSQRALLSNLCEFEVTCKGGKFTSPHSYSLTIPKGAIKDGESVKIKTGIMAYGPYGPFKCPENVTIVSPIVWFESEPEVYFSNPAVLKIQHCSSDRQHIGVLKGHHDAASELFQIDKVDVKKDTDSEDYVALLIDHFCVYCLGIYTPEQVEKARLCIIPIEGCKDQEKEMIFCITYCLDTCKQAVREQYNDRDYVVQPPIMICLSGSSVSIQCDLNNSSKWKAALKSGSNEISVSSINYWERFLTMNEMIAAHDEKTYPPRFRYVLSGGEQNEMVKFVFKGLKESRQYEVTLTSTVAGNDYEQGNEQPREDDAENKAKRDCKWNPND